MFVWQPSRLLREGKKPEGEGWGEHGPGVGFKEEMLVVQCEPGQWTPNWGSTQLNSRDSLEWTSSFIIWILTGKGITFDWKRQYQTLDIYNL